MKPAYFVCLLLCAFSAFLAASGAQSELRSLSPTLSGITSEKRFTHATRRDNAAPRTSILRPDGLSFAVPVSYLTGGPAAEDVAVVDVNGDGEPDILVSNNNNGTVGVLLGNGDGTFQPPVTYGTGGPAVGIAVGDVNGDGKLDIVVANGNSNNVGVLLGNGDGTFQPAVTYADKSQPVAVVLADVNGDGKPDVLAAGLGSVAVLIGNGDGTFQPAVLYSSGNAQFTESLAVTDVNGDGKLDVIAANSNQTGNGSIGVLLGNGDGTFQTVVTYDSGGFEAGWVALADVNADGKLDAIVANCGASGGSDCANGTVGVLLGNGDGTFQSSASYGSGGFGASSVALADVNGDNILDIVVTNDCISETECAGSDGTVAVLRGNGDGTFQVATSYNTDGHVAVSLAVLDLNADGKPDLVVSNSCSDGNCTSGSVSVLINTSLAASATTLVSSVNPCVFGQVVTFTASVTPIKETGTPTGTVTFFDGAITLGSSSLNSSGVSSFSTSTLAIGTHSVTATYNGDSNFGSSTSSVLSQVVQGAIVQLSPSSVNFGNQTVGMVSSPQIVNLTNTGNIALTISGLGITGTNSGDFSQTNTCGSSVAANGTCTITVTFTPTTTGTRSAAVTITDNAANSPQSVSLTGTGVQPAVTLSPTSLTFPTQIVFTSSKAQTVTLTNTGLGILTISKIAATGAFKQTNTCGSTVSPGNSCTLSVTFTPTKAGSLTGSVSITDNAPNSPQTVSLKGTGTDIQLNPTNFNFGNQPVGTKSLPKKFTLSNKSSTTVSVTGITITGINASDFVQTNTCGTSVSGGASCFITVTFTPSAKGARSASVSISDNGGGSPQKVKLSGTGT